ncbi:MAG: response regulator [Deltaproteobacteria bacterium]|jgi:two-component system, cell cycle response regulator DivK
MGKTIIVVEDAPLNMKLIREILTYRGDTVFEAANGREGVDLAIEKKPDLILMDIQMPVMDGMEAARLIKANPSTRHIPIVALTGYAMDGDEKQMREAGCDGYLSKPFKIKELLLAIDVFFDS